LRRFTPSLPLPVPSLNQVLARAGCPPGRAGEDIEGAALEAIASVSGISTAWCEAVFLPVQEKPGFLKGVFPDLPVTVMAATLGDGYDALRKQGELQAFLADAAASVEVEAFMRRLQMHLSETLGMMPTERVAPGYGNMPLAIQREIIGMFPASRIRCTEGFMLSPVKSMTGVTGWIKQQH